MNSVLNAFNSLQPQWKSVVLLSTLNGMSFSLPATNPANKVIKRIKALPTNDKAAIKTLLRARQRALNSKTLANNKVAGKRRGRAVSKRTTPGPTRNTRKTRTLNGKNLRGGVNLSRQPPTWYYKHLIQ